MKWTILVERLKDNNVEEGGRTLKIAARSYIEKPIKILMIDLALADANRTGP